jgi:hypothetical protein
MNDTGQDMRATLLAGSDDVPPGIDLLRGVRQQAAARRHHRRRVRVLVPAGAVTVAAGVAATLLATSATGSPSALAAVTSAVYKTSAQSYRFTLSSTVTGQGSVARGALTGAIDSRRNIGDEQLTWRDGNSATTAQILFIGHDVYTKASPGSVPRPWAKAPIFGPGKNVLPELMGVGPERPLSPTVLLGELRSAATVRKVGPASGPGWTGTKYAFTSRPRTSHAQEIVTGTVYVDQQGRVRGLAAVTTVHPLVEGHRAPAITGTYVLTFGDFGGPVMVTAPPASQVRDTIAPYWVLTP